VEAHGAASVSGSVGLSYCPIPGDGGFHLTCLRGGKVIPGADRVAAAYNTNKTLAFFFINF